MQSLSLSSIRGDTFQGATFTISASGIPLDLTGAILDIHLKNNACESDAVFKFSTNDNTISITSPLDGIFQINPVIIDLLAKNYVFDCQMELNGIVTTIFNGSFTIINDITR